MAFDTPIALAESNCAGRDYVHAARVLAMVNLYVLGLFAQKAVGYLRFR